MKEKAQKFMKKGKEIVEMNEKAIDAGATAYVKIDVPADWADAVDAPKAVSENGPEKLVKMVDSIMRPVGLMNGDSLPVSAFVDHADGTFEQGASAYEARRRGHGSRVERRDLRTVQPVLLRLPARNYPPVPSDRRRGCQRS